MSRVITRTWVAAVLAGTSWATESLWNEIKSHVIGLEMLLREILISGVKSYLKRKLHQRYQNAVTEHEKLKQTKKNIYYIYR